MTSVVDTLMKRNDTFATTAFPVDLKLLPRLRTTIVGCVDPRVDPAAIFGLALGEAAVIRNVGGRVYPSTLQTMAMLGAVAKAKGGAIDGDWNLVVLHHTDCGINCLVDAPEALARHFGIGTDDIAAKAVTDPYRSVAVDIAALKANPNIHPALIISGVVYDVATGRATVVVPPSPKGPGA